MNITQLPLKAATREKQALKEVSPKGKPPRKQTGVSSISTVDSIKKQSKDQLTDGTDSQVMELIEKFV